MNKNEQRILCAKTKNRFPEQLNKLNFVCRIVKEKELKSSIIRKYALIIKNLQIHAKTKQNTFFYFFIRNFRLTLLFIESSSK